MKAKTEKITLQHDAQFGKQIADLRKKHKIVTWGAPKSGKIEVTVTQGEQEKE